MVSCVVLCVMSLCLMYLCMYVCYLTPSFPSRSLTDTLLYSTLLYYITVAEAIYGEAKDRVHNHCCVYADEASLGQPDPEGPVCSRPTFERPFSRTHPAEEAKWNAEPPPSHRL